MEHPTRRFPVLAAGVLTPMLAFTFPLTGCKKEEPPPPPPPKVTQAPPPEAPSITPIAQLMKELGISNKIRLAEEYAPTTEHERVAVLKFFDAFTKSDAKALRSALSQTDRLVLDLMEQDGSFKSATEQVRRVDLVTRVVDGKAYVWADFQADGLHQWQLWEFTVAGEGRKIESQSFDSYVQPTNVASQIVIRGGNRSDVIPAWLELVANNMRQADIPDEILRPVAQRADNSDLDTESVADSGPGGQPAAPSGPNRPGPGRRRNVEPVRGPGF